MQEQFRCTMTCVHNKRYVVGEMFTGEEDELPHDKSGKLIHFVRIAPSIEQNNMKRELDELRETVARLRQSAASDTSKEVDSGMSDIRVVYGEPPEEIVKAKIKERLDILGIPWREPINKIQLTELLPKGETFPLEDGGIWMKQ